MILQIQKHMKKASLILIILAIFLSANVSSLEARRCEKAFLNCLLGSLRSLPNFTRVYLNIGYCLNGWVFCGKYLKK